MSQKYYKFTPDLRKIYLFYSLTNFQYSQAYPGWIKRLFAQLIHRKQTPLQAYKHNILCLTRDITTLYSMPTWKLLHYLPHLKENAKRLQRRHL